MLAGFSGLLNAPSLKPALSLLNTEASKYKSVRTHKHPTEEFLLEMIRWIERK